MKLAAAIYNRLIEGLAMLSGLMIGLVCLLIVWDVIARNLGWQPPASTVALTEYALLYFTMLAAPSLVRSRGHIVVQALHGRLQGTLRRSVDICIIVICLAVAGLVTILAAALMLEAVQRGEIEIRSLEMPRAFLFAPLVIGFGLMTTEFLRLLLRGEAVTDQNTQRESL